MSAIGGIGGPGFSPLTAPTLSQPPGAKTGGTGFQGGLDAVSKSIGAADAATAQVATGTATDLHAVSIAATKAQLGVTMTVALRNKAVEAYQEIMRMSV